MKYMNMKTFLLGSASFMALCSTAMLFGCAEENDPAALECFTRICTDDDDDSGDSRKDGKNGRVDTRSCDYTADGRYAIADCDIYDLGKTMYNFAESVVYACERSYFDKNTFVWTPQYNLTNCSEYQYTPQNYSSSSSARISSSSQSKRSEGCSYYAEDVKEYSCNEKEYGSTLYNESTETIFGCEYSKSTDDFVWIEYPRLKNCYDFEPDPYDP